MNNTTGKNLTEQSVTRLNLAKAGDGVYKNTLVAALDLYTAALHEAGHSVVACHLNLNPAAIVRPTGAEPTRKRSAFAGATEYAGPTSTLHHDRALVSWAGVLAEWYVDKRQQFKPTDLPSAAAFAFFYGGLNAQEKQWVDAYPEPSLTAAQSAAILEEHADELQAVARKLIDDCVRTQAKGVAKLRYWLRRGRDIKPHKGWQVAPEALAALVEIVYPDSSGKPRTDWPCRDKAF